jgi:hypothetical protein
MRRGLGLVLFACAAGIPGTSAAHDYWELGSVTVCSDDGTNGCNQPTLGVVQVHDLQSPVAGVFDIDHMIVMTRARRSYEATVQGTNVPFAADATCTECARMDRQDAFGNILTPGVSFDGVHPFNASSPRVAARWIGASADQRDFIRVYGGSAGFSSVSENDRYEVLIRDTTLAVPRWNNSATQATVFLISNQSAAVVEGFVYFYDASGALLHSEPLSVPVNGVRVMQTGTLAPLQGLSGSATIAHTGGYGALAGKAVALEPGTGFTFDTPMTPVPY